MALVAHLTVQPITLGLPIYLLFAPPPSVSYLYRKNFHTLFTVVQWVIALYWHLQSILIVVYNRMDILMFVQKIHH